MSRLARRAARLDKCNAFPVFADGRVVALVAIRLGQVYRVDVRTGEVTPTLTLRNCRNVLHQAICVTPKGSSTSASTARTPTTDRYPCTAAGTAAGAGSSP